MGPSHADRRTFDALAAIAALAACSLPTLREGGRRLSLLHDEPPLWLPVPVAGVAAVKLYDSFGNPRRGGRLHEGIDIFAPRGTPVGSATPGSSSSAASSAWAGAW